MTTDQKHQLTIAGFITLCAALGGGAVWAATELWIGAAAGLAVGLLLAIKWIVYRTGTDDANDLIKYTCATEGHTRVDGVCTRCGRRSLWAVINDQVDRARSDTVERLVKDS